MKKIVIYKSGTGFTKQYAEWIGAALDCEVKDIKKVSIARVSEAEVIIYGGWIMGSMVTGLDKIKAMNPKQLIVFGVGASRDGEEVRSLIMKQNHLEETPFFYFEGGLHFDQLNFLTKAMLKMVKKSIVKKENKTEQDIYMEKTLGTNVDHSDRSYIEPLLDYLKKGMKR